MNHGLLFELVNVASALRLIQVLVLLSDVEEQSLDQGG